MFTPPISLPANIHVVKGFRIDAADLMLKRCHLRVLDSHGGQQEIEVPLDKGTTLIHGLRDADLSWPIRVR